MSYSICCCSLAGTDACKTCRARANVEAPNSFTAYQGVTYVPLSVKSEPIAYIDLNRFMALRARLFKMIEKAIAEDPHHKSYEGAISIELPNYFEDGSTGFYAINLDCYVLGWQRHYTVLGKTFAEALDKFEKLLYEFEADGEDADI